jgi:hypothetical protein
MDAIYSSEISVDFHWIHGITSHKIKHFIVIDVRALKSSKNKRVYLFGSNWQLTPVTEK